MTEAENQDQRQGGPVRTRKDRPVIGNPDIHLDAPQLKVDELSLNLLSILKANIKGLEAELLLDADLDNLVDLLKRVVDALDKDDEGLSDIIDALGRALGSASGGNGDGEAPAKRALDAVKRALGSSGRESPDGSSSESPSDGEAGERTSEVRHEVDENGEVTRVTLNGAGEVLEEEVIGNVAELSGERG